MEWLLVSSVSYMTKTSICATEVEKYRDMDMRVQKNRERLIDGFVKAIIVYDDYFKVHLTYTDEPIDMPTTEEIEFMGQSSDIASAVSPKKTHTIWCVFFFW